MRLPYTAAAGAALFIAALAGTVGCNPAQPENGSPYPNVPAEEARKIPRHIAPADAAATRIAWQHMESMVLVETVRAQGTPGSLGTGVIIDTHGSIITAWHVIEGARDITVSFVAPREAPALPAGRYWKVVQRNPEHAYRVDLSGPAKLVRVSKKNDVALLSVEDWPFSLQPIDIDLQRPAPNDTVYQLGRASDTSSGKVISSHATSAVPDLPVNDVISTDTPAWHGDSGGPLLSSHGALVGICISINEESHTAFFTPVATALKALGINARSIP